MVFGFSFSDLLLVGVAIAVLGPKDVGLVARAAGRLTGKAVAYIQKSRTQFGDILQRNQANQVHNELRETLAQLEAIRHEIQSGMSIMNPAPLTREILKSAAAGVHAKPVQQNTASLGTEVSSHATATPQEPHLARVVVTEEMKRAAAFTLPQEMLKDSSFSEWVNMPIPERAPKESPVNHVGSNPNNPMAHEAPAVSEIQDIAVLPVSAVDAGLLPERKGGVVTGADIVLECVVEQRVAFQALEFFEQQGQAIRQP